MEVMSQTFLTQVAAKNSSFVWPDIKTSTAKYGMVNSFIVKICNPIVQKRAGFMHLDVYSKDPDRDWDWFFVQYFC